MVLWRSKVFQREIVLLSRGFLLQIVLSDILPEFWLSLLQFPAFCVGAQYPLHPAVDFISCYSLSLHYP